MLVTAGTDAIKDDDRQLFSDRISLTRSSYFFQTAVKFNEISRFSIITEELIIVMLSQSDCYMDSVQHAIRRTYRHINVIDLSDGCHYLCLGITLAQLIQVAHGR